MICAMGILMAVLGSTVAHADTSVEHKSEESISVPFALGVGYGYRSLLAPEEGVSLEKLHEAVVSWRWGVSRSVWIGGSFQGGGNLDLYSLRFMPLNLQFEIWSDESVRPFIAAGVGMQIERRRDNDFDQNKASLGVSGIVTSISPGVVLPIFDWLEMQANIQIDLVYEDGASGGIEIEAGGLVSFFVSFDS